tara:strand:+ start:258 stop:365 length:108 start_codon:yes stop_codon:yes gene_type:complete
MTKFPAPEEGIGLALKDSPLEAILGDALITKQVYG